MGNNDVRLNLVPVDFVTTSIATLARDDDAIGKTLALADPSPLSTEELFDVIAKEMTGRRSEFRPPKKLTEWFLNTSISPAITGLPHHAVPYFFISQTYGTDVATKLLSKRNVTCPNFRDYVGKLLDFVEDHPAH